MKKILIMAISGFLVLSFGCQTTSENSGMHPAPTSLAFHPTEAPLALMQERGLIETGLKPIYPTTAQCPRITSFFADQTRGDGSYRNVKFYHGYHSGMDIPAPEGTPVLAIADGTVVEKKYGVNIGGIEIILQHSPEDTGLSGWLYSQYKHLKEMPEANIGAKVKMGERIGLVGKTGTVGGYYGYVGHSHLHLAVLMSRTNEYKAMKAFVPVDGFWVDPLAVFAGKNLDSKSIRNLEGEQKNVKIPYMTTTNEIIPSNSKFIWPLPCTAN